MAAADEISVNAVIGATFPELDDIDTIKEEHTSSTEGFFFGRHLCFALLRTGFGKRSCDAQLMLRCWM